MSRHEHHHENSHTCHHHDLAGARLFWAVVVNLLLTLAQIVGGVLSGSVALIADALHNLSDAGALAVAYLAQKISGLPANKEMTFGYGRAQVLGALINSLTLFFVGVYLIIEAWKRFLNPQEIDGLMVIIVACVALVIDLVTAWLTYKGSDENINLRAAFIHNLSDALASVVVILSGFCALWFDLYQVDFIATLVISIYVFWHSWGLTRSCIRTLMQAVPEDLTREEVVDALEELEGVVNVHHVHIWSLYDDTRMFEAHIRVETKDLEQVEAVKTSCKQVLKEQFKIGHSTLEFEPLSSKCKT